MERKDIIGKEFTCFEFKTDSQLSYNEQKKYVGSKGVVKELHRSYPQYACVVITDHKGIKGELYYPSDMILEQLKKLQEEEEKSVDDIIIEMKQLIYRI